MLERARLQNIRSRYQSQYCSTSMTTFCSVCASWNDMEEASEVIEGLKFSRWRSCSLTTSLLSSNRGNSQGLDLMTMYSTFNSNGHKFPSGNARSGIYHRYACSKLIRQRLSWSFTRLSVISSLLIVVWKDGIGALLLHWHISGRLAQNR